MDAVRTVKVCIFNLCVKKILSAAAECGSITFVTVAEYGPITLLRV
jgi:hypothetical protein